MRLRDVEEKLSMWRVAVLNGGQTPVRLNWRLIYRPSFDNHKATVPEDDITALKDNMRRESCKHKNHDGLPLTLSSSELPE